MSYDFDIFISYRRTQTVGAWVKNHLMPRLTDRMDELSPSHVKISCDFQMESGSSWPDELKRRLKHSGLLLAVWSANYFRSSWCMAEWRSFKERENMLGLFCASNPHGLVYPIRYADGDHYHQDARQTQCNKDFSQLNYPDPIFKMSAKYMDFDDLVKEMAAELISKIQNIPSWRADFPIVEPQPMPPAALTRPLL